MSTTYFTKLSFLLSLLLLGTNAFCPYSSPSVDVCLTSHFGVGSSPRSSLTILKMGYVPDGMTPEQYKQMKAKEEQKKKSKNYGAVGPRGFQSRSMRAFQEDLEKGKAGHLMPMFNSKDKLKKGLIKEEDVPYMQRGGSWDNSDVRGAKKREWTKTDKNYKADMSPGGLGLDWSGSNKRKGPSNANTNSAKKGGGEKKKKRFGMF